ncbi:MAG: hypothetical protein HY840_02800 [Bacteroidetes bacterium]|nr:hypothetical protein [Bacteroidota bacterium]
MIKRRIIATKISITKQGEIKFFQVKVPFDAKVIIGIETAMRLKTFRVFPSQPILVPFDNPYGNIVAFNGTGNPTGQAINGSGIFPINNFSPSPIDSPIGATRNSLVGELKLQSSDDSNIFYATNISDPSVKEGLDKVPSVNFMIENVWTHGYKRQLEEVLVDANTTVIAGLYKDRLGEMLKADVSYDVFLYIWYKFEKPIDNDNQPCS